MTKKFFEARFAGRFGAEEVSTASDDHHLVVVLNFLSSEGKNRVWEDPWIFQRLTEEAHAALFASPEEKHMEWQSVRLAAVAYDRVAQMERSQAKAWLRGE